VSNQNVIRAWKDPAYRNSLSEAERSAMPANPAGSIEISDGDLGKVAGGVLLTFDCSAMCSYVVVCPTRGILCSLRPIICQ
jgi:mersacidin/lichenicidin family type 2 lantibiotic